MKKRSLAGLIALFMVIAFPAVSFDNAAGGGDNSLKPNATQDGFIALLDKLAEDDVEAIVVTIFPPIFLILDGETGEPVLGNGFSLEDNGENGTLTFKDYKVIDEDSGKTLTVNGTYSFIDEITTSKITVTGSTNGPVKSNFTISGDIDEDSEEEPEIKGTLTIGSQTFAMNVEIYVMIMMIFSGLMN